MKKVKKSFKKSKGFTLIEMLVVVLIIGILAGIALPQYQMAVTKAKVAGILPIMRRWIDAYQEYYLQHNSYLTEEGDVPDTDTLGVSWPSDWTCDEDSKGANCWNDYWDCFSNEDTLEYDSIISCVHRFSNTERIHIELNQGTEPDGVRLCIAYGSATSQANKVCKALGGNFKRKAANSYIYSF